MSGEIEQLGGNPPDPKAKYLEALKKKRSKAGLRNQSLKDPKVLKSLENISPPKLFRRKSGSS